jgi:hypothetical protein
LLKITFQRGPTVLRWSATPSLSSVRDVVRLEELFHRGSDFYVMSKRNTKH